MSQADLDLCAKRYMEAQAKPTAMQWNSLALMAMMKGQKIMQDDPASETGEAIKAIADKAWANYIAMLPQREEADLSRSAGVLCGLFRRAA